MRKIVATIIAFLTICVFSHGRKIGTFRGINLKIPILKIDNEQIYIADQGLKKFYIFKRNTFAKVAETGRYGEGPGEFLGINQFAIDDKNIYVSSFPKLCIFSREGKFIKEMRGPFKTGDYKALGDHFIGTCYLNAGPSSDYVKVRFDLLDSTLKKEKELLLTAIHSYNKNVNGKKINYMITDCFASFVYKDRLYIGTTEKGFYFAVFDLNGKKLFEIKRDIEKRKITAVEKERLIKGIRLGMGEEKWKIYKTQNEIAFGEYYPAYQTFFVNDDKIYVFSFLQTNGFYKIHILDLKGNLIKLKFVSVFDIFMEINSKYDYILNGKLYRLGEKNEEYELNEFDIYP